MKTGDDEVRPVTLAVMFVAWFAFWVASRWPAVHANTLFFDDFGVPSDPALFYIGSYRPIVWLEYTLVELCVPNHFWTSLPKYLAAAYMAATMSALSVLLVRWRVPLLLALAVPLVAIANPVLNDAGLWQALHAIPIGLALIVGAFLAWERQRWLGGSLLLLAGVFTYQIFISLALVLLVAEPVIKRSTGMPWRAGDAARKLVAIVACGVLQIVVMEVMRRFLPAPDARGFTHVTTAAAFLHEKLHGIANLVVNGSMPVIAYYAGARRAMSLWKFVPVAIAAACAVARFVRTRRFGVDVCAAFAAPLVLYALPASPVIITSQSPYAWRVSSPMAIALALSLVPLLVDLCRPAIGVAIVVAIAFILVPVSYYESSQRVVGRDRDLALLEAIDRHWSRGAYSIALAPGAEDVPEDPRKGGPRDLTWGYDRRMPAAWSNFNARWAARQFVVHWAKRPFVDCNSAPCPRIACRTRGDVIFDDRERIALVCP